MVLAFSTLYWWRMAWLPSRSVTSEMYIFFCVMEVSSGNQGGEQALGHLLGGAQRGAGHDVQVAGVSRQVVGGAFDLQEDRGLQPGETVAHAGDANRPVGFDTVELHALLQAVAGHVD